MHGTTKLIVCLVLALKRAWAGTQHEPLAEALLQIILEDLIDQGIPEDSLREQIEEITARLGLDDTSNHNGQEGGE